MAEAFWWAATAAALCLLAQVRLRLAVRYRYGGGRLAAGLELCLPAGLRVRWAVRGRGAGRRWTTWALVQRLRQRARQGQVGQVFLARARVQGVSWHTRIGLGDAALTGAAIGLLWAVKGAWVASLVARHGPLLRAPDLRIEPSFAGWLCESEYACIYVLRLWDVMAAMPCALRAFLRAQEPRLRQRGGSVPAASH